MNGTVQPRTAGPTTHYEFFGSLNAARVAWLVTGATALVLHGVPRLTCDVDLVVDPSAANLERLDGLLAAWGYGKAGDPSLAGGSVSVRRFRHPVSALEEIDVVLPLPEDFTRLQSGSAAVTLVDVGIPIVGATDLCALKEQTGSPAGRNDAEALATLAAIRAGGKGGDDATGTEQIRKFSRWSVAARLDWLLAAARLGKGLSPEAKPMTRGLVRRRGWYGR